MLIRCQESGAVKIKRNGHPPEILVDGFVEGTPLSDINMNQIIEDLSVNY